LNFFEYEAADDRGSEKPNTSKLRQKNLESRQLPTIMNLEVI